MSSYSGSFDSAAKVVMAMCAGAGLWEFGQLYFWLGVAAIFVAALAYEAGSATKRVSTDAQ